jgi:hypothetical protein
VLRRKVSLQSKSENILNQRSRERCSKDLIHKFFQIQKIRVVGWCKGRLVPAEGVGASLSVVAD